MSANNTLRPRASWNLAAWAACLLMGWAGACGRTDQSAGRLPDGSSGGAGGVKTDASTGAGGAVGTGGMGTDAGTGTGGAIETGGVTSDAGAGVACSDDGGVGFAAVARQCTQDSDCTILTAATCCGADNARGIAKTQASAYAGCFALPPGACSGLGCAEYLGYLTDTGKTTPFLGTDTQPIDLVSVRCVGHLCTTDVVVPPTDVGQDVPSAVDTAWDAGSQSCGSTTCHSGQACVLRSGGPAPLCQALGDGGCPPGLVYAASCRDPATGDQVSPGCTEPAPAPGCVDLPDACSGDLCNCLCPAVGGVECSVTSAYVLCGYP
jgi:hypothetical protein